MVNETDTKDKILKTAHILFAQRGFSGTSVREISSLADVNISAINYHFTNKENLYKEVVDHCFSKTSIEIQTIYQTHKASTFDFSVAILRHFIKNSHDFKTSIKIFFIEDEMPNALELMPMMNEHNHIGPPGGDCLYESLKVHAPDCSEESVIWGVRVIFSHIVQMSLIANSACHQRMKDQYAFHTDQEMESGLVRLVSLIINELKSEKSS